MNLDVYEKVAIVCALIVIGLFVADFLNHLPGGI